VAMVDLRRRSAGERAPADRGAGELGDAALYRVELGRLRACAAVPGASRSEDRARGEVSKDHQGHDARDWAGGEGDLETRATGSVTPRRRSVGHFGDHARRIGVDNH